MKQWLKHSLLTALSLLLVLSLTACDSSTGGRYTDDNDDDGITIPSFNLDLTDIVTINETPLVDNDTATITAKSLTYDNGTAVLKLSIDNHSENTINVTLGGCAVNGITMQDVSMNAKVTAGKTVDKTVSFSGLDAYDILMIKDFTFIFNCYDQDSYESYFTTPPITLTTVGAELYTQTYDQSGTTLYEKNNIKVLFKRAEHDADKANGAELWLYVDNDNDFDEQITMRINDLAINNSAIEYYTGTVIMPNSVAVTCIRIAQSELDENNITSIDQLEMSLQFADDNGSIIGESDLLRIMLS